MKAKAWRVIQPGSLTQFKLEEVSLNGLSKSTVRIKTKAIGVNPADLMQVMSTHQNPPPLPFSPGFEVGGIAEESSAAKYKVRDCVMASPDFGAYQVLALGDDFFIMTGPEAISGAQIAEILSLLQERKVTWNKDEKAFEQQAQATGTPLFLKEVYKTGAAGAFETVSTENYRQVSDRAPTSFARFVWDYRYFFSNFSAVRNSWEMDEIIKEVAQEELTENRVNRAAEAGATALVKDINDQGFSEDLQGMDAVIFTALTRNNGEYRPVRCGRCSHSLP